MIHLILFLKLAIGHFLFDYPLQGDFLSKAKNHNQPIPGVPWYQALVAHAAIQGGVVWYLTGWLSLGITEFILHGITDYLKCDGRINFNQDQAIHLGCKLLFVGVIYFYTVL